MSIWSGWIEPWSPLSKDWRDPCCIHLWWCCREFCLLIATEQITPKRGLNNNHFIMSQGFGGSGISRAQQGCSEWVPQKQSQRQEFACKWFVKGHVRERSVKAWERGSRSGKRRKLRQDMISDHVLQRAGFSLIQGATLEGQLSLSYISDVLIWCRGPELSHSYTWQSLVVCHPGHQVGIGG